jgi:hypothetical protein
MKNEFICKTRASALTALDAITENLPAGTQQSALLAVKAWIEDNCQAMQSREETNAILAKIFERTPGEQKGLAWYKKKKGELVSTEPEDGAEWKCAWNGKTKTWEPLESETD